MVGIIRGPHIFSPFRDPEAALEQRAQTLNRMVTMGFITRDRRAQIAAELLRLVPEESRETQTSYALQAVRRELDAILDTEEIPSTGLRVRTTIHAAWQGASGIRTHARGPGFGKRKSWPHPVEGAYVPGSGEPAYVQYAAITTETKTGATLALIGGRNYTHSRFDRTRSTRDLGSAFEPSFSKFRPCIPP